MTTKDKMREVNEAQVPLKALPLVHWQNLNVP